MRVAIGRDDAGVPPTRGVFEGQPKATLGVKVNVIGPQWGAAVTRKEAEAK